MLQWFVGESQVIMGVDPGSRTTGYGVIAGGRALAWGTLCPPINKTFEEKIYFLHKGLQAVCQKWGPSQVAIENVFVSQNVKSAFSLAHIRGAVMLVAVQAKAKVFELAPARVKKIITGSGRAEKNHVALVLKQLLQLPQDFKAPLDVTDALALAFACSELQRRPPQGSVVIGGGAPHKAVEL